MPGFFNPGKCLTIGLAALAFLAVALAAASGLAGESAQPRPEAVPPAEARAAFQKSARDLRLQTEMPVPRETRQPIDIDLPSGSWGISEAAARYILCGAVLIIVLVVLWNWRGLQWSDSRARRMDGEDLEEVAPEAVRTRLESARFEADELARQGLFAQAMHVLLLQSVSELRRRLDISIAISLTSREILARLALPPAGRVSLADIVGRVEVCYFGDREPGPDEYAACRSSFQTLTEALRQGSAA